MDINIDGTISTYNKNDPRGIHVGHSIYFADSYDDLINKYTDGETVVPDPGHDTDDISLLGISKFKRTFVNEHYGNDEEIDWSTHEFVYKGYRYSIKFIDNGADIPADYIGGTTTIEKTNVSLDRIDTITVTKDSTAVTPTIIREIDCTFYYGGFNLSNYYKNKDSINLVATVTIPLSPENDYAFCDSYSYGILGVDPDDSSFDESTSNFYSCESWVKGFNKYLLKDTVYPYPSINNHDIDLKNEKLRLQFAYNQSNDFLIRDSLPENGTISMSIQVLDNIDIKKYITIPEDILITDVLCMNMIVSGTYESNGTSKYMLSSNCYNFATGEGGQNNNPYYSSVTGDCIYPGGVKMTLNMDMYNNYVSPTLFTGSRYFFVYSVIIREIHLILNGSVTYDRDLDLCNVGINYTNPRSYNIIGAPDGDYPFMNIEYMMPKVCIGEGIIICIDDGTDMPDGTNIFDISATFVKKTDNGYSTFDYTIYPAVSVTYKSSQKYIYIPFRSLCANSEFQALDDSEKIYICNLSLSFGYVSSTSNCIGSDYMTNTDRTGIVFNNFKFSIYAGPDPTISTQSTNEKTKTPVVMAAPLVKPSAIQTYSETQSNQFLNLLPMGCYNTWDDFHLIPTSRPIIAPPSVKTNTIDLPGGSGVLDLSYSLTKCPLYENRTGSLEFIVDPDRDTWINVYQKLSNYLDGRYRYMTLEDDPYWVYEGKFMVNDWKSDEHWSTITIDYDVKPYKRYILKTDPDQSLSTGRTKIPYYDELKSTFMGIGALPIDNPTNILLNVDLYSTIPVCPSFTVRFGAVRITITRIENQVYIDEPISVSQKIGNHVKIISTYDTEKPKDVYTPIYVNDLSLMFQGQCTLQVQALDNTVTPQVDVIFRPGIL